MKIPLRYQVSEYDCGPTSLLNALNYLFQREEISVGTAEASLEKAHLRLRLMI